MLFSSIIFLFYFLPIMIILYYGCQFSRNLQNVILLIGSLVFYAWGEPQFIMIMIISVLMNTGFALWVDRYRDNKKVVRVILGTTAVFNLSILFVFKYLGFTIRTLNEVAGVNLVIPQIALPIGISFFTFQGISYVIDVYRKEGKAQRNPFFVGLYIAFFPQLIAGPIVRYSTIAQQLKERRETWDKVSIGICRFIIGLSKKLLLSNSMAIIVDHIYELHHMGPIAVSLAWLGSIAYTLQIFFDFSGYSDMAIGLGLVFGFKFDENFNYPYISQSITEFWRRWHISLGSWFRDYVYIPLGGSRVKNKDKIILNLFVVWLLTGVWHGAEWTFIMWGLLNFLIITIEKILGLDRLEGHRVWRHLYTLFIINIGWVIFRAPNLVSAGNYIKTMFGIDSTGFWSDYTWMFLKEYIVFWITGIIFCMPIAKRMNRHIVEKKVWSNVLDYIYPVALMGLFLICVTYLVKGTYNPFIYFNF